MNYMKVIIFLGLLWPGLRADGHPDVPSYLLPPARMSYDDGQDAMSSRLFRTTTLRRQVNLAGWWDFASDRLDAGETSRYFEKFPQPETQLWVPGTPGITSGFSWTAARRRAGPAVREPALHLQIAQIRIALFERIQIQFHEVVLHPS
jgi:hypothetical protein